MTSVYRARQNAGGAGLGAAVLLALAKGVPIQ